MRRPVVEYPSDGSVQPVGRYVWSPVEVPPARAPSEALAGKRIALAGGHELTADRVAEVLTSRGAKVSRYAPGSRDPAEAATGLLAAAGALDGIVDLTLEPPFSLQDTDAWRDPLLGTYTLLRAVYEDWARESNTSRLFYLAVTYLDGQMGYSGEDVMQPLGGIWAGLAKTLPTELPNCNIRILDLSPKDREQIGSIVARELYDWGLFEIGYRGGLRYSLQGRREDVGPPSISLAAADTVLMTGGARGIGFVMARALARTFGCRVVVTGRTPVPDEAEQVLQLDDSSFEDYRQALFRKRPEGWTLAETRRHVEGLKLRRQLHRHLREAASEGLDLEYRVCDVTSLESIRHVIESIGPGLSGVIHNAGVDAPARLYAKSPESVLVTVSTKVTGFLNLMEATQGKELRFFCNVGSMTGRMGGTQGQTDYAGANEALARLGLWASAQVGIDVKTLGWPTWNRVGLITNFDAALQFMSAMDVEEGIDHWQRELLARGSGEIGFMGSVGAAVLPGQLYGYLPIRGMPGIEGLYSRAFYLGRVLDFRPFQFMRSMNVLDARYAPCLHDWTSDGVPSVPVSVILELGVAAGEEVQPEGGKGLRLQAMQDVAIELGRLQHTGSYTLEKEAAGHWSDSRWMVDVRLTKLEPEARRDVAHLHLVYETEDFPAEAAPQPVDEGTSADMPLTPAFSWAGLVYPIARWRRGADGTLVSTVRAAYDADLWSTPSLPRSTLPASQLENVVRAGMAVQGQVHPNARLVIHKIALSATAGTATVLVGRPDEQTWWAADQNGRVGLRLEGLRYEQDISMDHAVNEARQAQLPDQ